MRPRSSWGSGLELLATTLVFCSSLSRPKVRPRVEEGSRPPRGQSVVPERPRPVLVELLPDRPSLPSRRLQQGSKDYCNSSRIFCLPRRAKSLGVSRTPQGLGD